VNELVEWTKEAKLTLKSELRKLDVDLTVEVVICTDRWRFLKEENVFFLLVSG